MQHVSYANAAIRYKRERRNFHFRKKKKKEIMTDISPEIIRVRRFPI